MWGVLSLFWGNYVSIIGHTLIAWEFVHHMNHIVTVSVLYMGLFLYISIKLAVRRELHLRVGWELTVIFLFFTFSVEQSIRHADTTTSGASVHPDRSQLKAAADWSGWYWGHVWGHRWISFPAYSDWERETCRFCGYYGKRTGRQGDVGGGRPTCSLGIEALYVYAFAIEHEARVLLLFLVILVPWCWSCKCVVMIFKVVFHFLKNEQHCPWLYWNITYSKGYTYSYIIC